MNLNDIRESFLSRTFNVEEVRWLLIGIAVLCIVLLGAFVVKTILMRRKRYTPYGSVTDPEKIGTLLRQAFDQRRYIELQFESRTDTRRPSLRCSPEYLGQDSLTVEAGGIKQLSDKWLDRPVQAFFHLTLDHGFVYYTFASRITGIHTPRKDVCHLTLAAPKVLENRQKRAFLRLTPPPEFLLGAAIWHDKTLPADENLHDLAKWPRPLLLVYPGRMEQFRILDLSAGGMRICIPHDVARALSLHFSAVEHVFVILDLFDPENGKRLRWWMRCRVQSVWVDLPRRDIHLGLQFQSWAKAKESRGENTTGSELEWLRLSTANEVEPIGNWIMRRHLEMFREYPGSGNKN